MVKTLNAAEYGRVQFGKDKDGSFISKQGRIWASGILLEACIYIEIGVLGLLEPTN